MKVLTPSGALCRGRSPLHVIIMANRCEFWPDHPRSTHLCSVYISQMSDMQCTVSRRLVAQRSADEPPKLAWDVAKAPMPTRFVRRKSKCGGFQATASNQSETALLSAMRPTIVDVGEEVWAFATSTNTRNNNLIKFYAAHRQHVAQEIATSFIAESEINDAQWDQASELFLSEFQ
jgi:hypothetical protein